MEFVIPSSAQQNLDSVAAELSLEAFQEKETPSYN